MIVTFKDMPATIKGAVVKQFDDGEDYFTIILNASLTKEEQEKAYWHEMFHINNDDFYSDEPIGLIEGRAHEYRNN